MSKTRAEIEAEIARLRARLDHVEIDPAFTPTELVRWDPSLLGAVLHIKHERRFYSKTFHKVMTIESGTPATPSVEFIYMASNPSRIRIEPTNPSSAPPVCNHPPLTFEQACDRDISTENTGVLTQTGIRSVWTEFIERRVDRHKLTRRYETTNTFTDIANLPLAFQLLRKEAGVTAHASWTYGPGGVFDLKCTDLGITVRNNNLLLPLANPDRPLLDQIFVATTTRVGDTDIIVDKYPLSTLYNEWKRDKEAAPDHISTKMCGVRRPMRPMIPPLRRTELDKAKAQIAELQAQMRVLMADRDAFLAADRAKEAELAKQNERLREALHVAVQTPNLMGLVPSSSAATVASTNVTSLMNATASADPV